MNDRTLRDSPELYIAADTPEGVLIPHDCWNTVLENFSALATQSETLIQINQSLLQAIISLLDHARRLERNASGTGDPYSLEDLKRLLSPS